MTSALEKMEALAAKRQGSRPQANRTMAAAPGKTGVRLDLIGQRKLTWNKEPKPIAGNRICLSSTCGLFHIIRKDDDVEPRLYYVLQRTGSILREIATDVSWDEAKQAAQEARPWLQRSKS